MVNEKLGRQWEMAICLALNTPYVGRYTYGMEVPQKLAQRLHSLSEHVGSLTHNPCRHGRHDFLATQQSGQVHVSAKSSKVKNAKVAPQVVGQSLKNLCTALAIDTNDVSLIKRHLQENTEKLLRQMEDYTFSGCSLLYYNAPRDTILLVNQINPIPLKGINLHWTRPWSEWRNSSSIKIDNVSVAEVQFHSKSRTNPAIRWYIDRVLEMFPSSFVTTHF